MKDIGRYVEVEYESKIEDAFASLSPVGAWTHYNIEPMKMSFFKIVIYEFK